MGDLQDFAEEDVTEKMKIVEQLAEENRIAEQSRAAEETLIVEKPIVIMATKVSEAKNALNEFRSDKYFLLCRSILKYEEYIKSRRCFSHKSDLTEIFNQKVRVNAYL